MIIKIEEDMWIAPSASTYDGYDNGEGEEEGRRRGGKEAFGLDLMGRDSRNNLKLNCCSISRENLNMITTRMYI